MPVVGLDGHLGSVEEVIADTELDVFRGIVVLHGLLGMRRTMVGPDVIVAVTDDAVELSLARADFDQLPDREATP